LKRHGDRHHAERYLPILEAGHELCLRHAPLRLLFAGIVATLSCSIAAPAAEICRFTGTTDYSGHVAVTTRVTARAGAIQVTTSFGNSGTTFNVGLTACRLTVYKLRPSPTSDADIPASFSIGTRRHSVSPGWTTIRPHYLSAVLISI
jgi:hypothetical protein